MPRESEDTYFRKGLVEELRMVENLMRKEPSIEKKIYYFSAAFGIFQRTHRFSFHREYLLADFVLNASYSLLQQRLAMLKTGDMTVRLEEKDFVPIYDGLKALANALGRDEPVQDALETLLTAAYAVSGPGNYQKERGSIKI
jgi:hypothetical protein